MGYADSRCSHCGVSIVCDRSCSVTTREPVCAPCYFWLMYRSVHPTNTKAPGVSTGGLARSEGDHNQSLQAVAAREGEAA